MTSKNISTKQAIWKAEIDQAYDDLRKAYENGLISNSPSRADAQREASRRRCLVDPVAAERHKIYKEKREAMLERKKDKKMKSLQAKAIIRAPEASAKNMLNKLNHQIEDIEYKRNTIIEALKAAEAAKKEAEMAVSKLCAVVEENMHLLI